MRIGINLTHLIPGKIGGMENYIRALIKYAPLERPEHKYFIICLKDLLPTLKNLEENIKVITVNNENLSKNLIDVIEKNNIEAWISPLLILDPLQTDITKAFTIPDMQHEYYPDFFDIKTLEWRKRYFQLSALSSDLIFTISNDSKKDIEKFLKTPSKKITVTYLDTDKIFHKKIDHQISKKIKKELHLPDQYLFFPANTWPHKNHRKLFKAFKILQKKYPELHLLFSGYPSSGHKEIMKEIEKNKNNKNIRFLGYLEKKYLPYIYDNALCLVFPSLFEGFGIPVLEAMHTGCPVLCSRCTSLPEIAKDAALYFNPNSASDIAKKVEQIIKNPQIRKSLINKGHKRAKHFSYKKMAAQTIDALNHTHKKKIANRYKGNKPKITIVTPSYNQGEFIEDTIKSVLNQNYPNLEYLIFDGGSTDQSVEIIKKYAKQYPEIIRWYSGKDKGQTDAINKGFEIATGEIVAWLNSDDTYEPNAINKVVKYFNDHPESKFLHGIGHHITKTGEFIEEYPSEDTSFEKLHTCCQICQPTTFWKKEIFFDIGYPDEKLNFAMDYDYWIRISQKYKINFLKEHLANTRFYEDTKTSGQAQKAHLEILQVIKKYYTNVSSSWIYGYAHAALSKTKRNNKIQESLFRLKLIGISLSTFLKYNKSVPKSELKTLYRWFKDALLILVK